MNELIKQMNKAIENVGKNFGYKFKVEKCHDADCQDCIVIYDASLEFSQDSDIDHLFYNEFNIKPKTSHVDDITEELHKCLSQWLVEDYLDFMTSSTLMGLVKDNYCNML